MIPLVANEPCTLFEKETMSSHPPRKQLDQLEQMLTDWPGITAGQS
jgi:hypothetical protein